MLNEKHLSYTCKNTVAYIGLVGIYVHVLLRLLSVKKSSRLTDRLTDTRPTMHRASTSMYSLTFRVRVTTPRSMDEMERRTQQACRCYRRRGSQSSPASVVRAACSGPGGLPLGSATHFHSVAIATQPVHRLQIRPVLISLGFR